MTETIGIIAGESLLPLLSCREARRRGWRTVVAAVKGAGHCPSWPPRPIDWAEFPLGRLGGVIRFFKRHGVRRALMIGRVRHAAIFSLWTADAKFLRFLAKVKDRTTTSLLATLADFFAARGHRDHRFLFFPRRNTWWRRRTTRRGCARGSPGRGHRVRLGKGLGHRRPGHRPDGVRQGSGGGRRRGHGGHRPAPSSGRRRSPAPGWSWPRSAGRARTCASTCRWWGCGPWRCWRRCRAAAFVLEAGKTLMLDPEELVARAGRARSS